MTDFSKISDSFGAGEKAPLEKINFLLSHARKNLPAYDALCRASGLSNDAPKSLEEIKNIPPMTRADLAMKTNLLRNGTAVTNLKSGGTSRTDRLETALDVGAVLKRYASLLAVLSATGWDMGQKTAALHPIEYGYFNNLGEMIRERAFSKMAFEFFQQYILYGLFHNRENIPYASGIFSRPHEAAGLLERALHKTPVLLITRPDALMAALKAGGPVVSRATGRLKAVLTVGTVLGETVRLEAEEKLNAMVFNMYASTELGYVALNCARSGEWLHVNESDYFAETDASGEILITDFNNRLMPMLRYRTGDMG